VTVAGNVDHSEDTLTSIARQITNSNLYVTLAPTLVDVATAAHAAAKTTSSATTRPATA
jgi:hypothetical protein